MDERKRRSSPPGDSSEGHASRRRKLSTSVAVQLQSASADEQDSEPPELDAAFGLEDGFLETFRKGALYRQMLEYKREWARISSKAEKVEQDWKESHEKLSELETCWTRLVDELREALGTGQDNAQMVNGHADDTGSNASDLSRRVQETSHLIALLAKKSLPNVSLDIVQRQDALAKELIHSQATVAHLEKALEDTRKELDRTLDALRTVQKQVDRRQSESVRKLNKISDRQADEEKPRSLLKPGSAVASTAPSPAAGSPGHASPFKHDMKEEQEQNELRDVLEGSSGLTRSEIEALQQEAESRQKEAESLRTEKLALSHELDSVKARYAVVPDDRIRETPLFVAVQEKLNEYKTLSESAQATYDKVKNELDSMKAKETQFRQDLEEEYAKETTKLNKDLTRLQQDLTRIRTERDSGVAELSQYKARESEKAKHIEEMKALANSRQIRITTLLSEVFRLRIVLAAENGDSEALRAYEETWERLKTETSSALAGDTMGSRPSETPLPEEALVRQLQDRVKELEHLTITYRENLKTLSGGAPDEDLDMAEQLVRGEAQAKADLDAAQARLSKLEDMLGDNGAPDIARITRKLADSEKLISTLEGKVKANDLSTNMLISEVGRLSETWEQLNKQNHSKILDLAQYDVRLERMATERAKANQKYFASEREKEALVNQSNTYLRLSNNQKAAISILESERRAFVTKLATCERELVAHQAAETLLEKRISEIERERSEKAAAYAALQKQFAEQSNVLSDRTTHFHSEETLRKKSEDQVSKLEKEVEKWKSKANQATAAANGQGRYVETDVKGLAEENNLLKRMLKCSSCRQKFKSHTITRCYHMFCKDCIDSRLETRQRKCPSCSAAFGAHDVQQVYF